MANLNPEEIVMGSYVGGLCSLTDWEVSNVGSTSYGGSVSLTFDSSIATAYVDSNKVIQITYNTVFGEDAVGTLLWHGNHGVIRSTRIIIPHVKAVYKYKINSQSVNAESVGGTVTGTISANPSSGELDSKAPSVLVDLTSSFSAKANPKYTADISKISVPSVAQVPLVWDAGTYDEVNKQYVFVGTGTLDVNVDTSSVFTEYTTKETYNWTIDTLQGSDVVEMSGINVTRSYKFVPKPSSGTANVSNVTVSLDMTQSYCTITPPSGWAIKSDPTFIQSSRVQINWGDPVETVDEATHTITLSYTGKGYLTTDLITSNGRIEQSSNIYKWSIKPWKHPNNIANATVTGTLDANPNSGSTYVDSIEVAIINNLSIKPDPGYAKDDNFIVKSKATIKIEWDDPVYDESKNAYIYTGEGQVPGDLVTQEATVVEVTSYIHYKVYIESTDNNYWSHTSTATGGTTEFTFEWDDSGFYRDGTLTDKSELPSVLDARWDVSAVATANSGYSVTSQPSISASLSWGQWQNLSTAYQEEWYCVGTVTISTTDAVFSEQAPPETTNYYYVDPSTKESLSVAKTNYTINLSNISVTNPGTASNPNVLTGSTSSVVVNITGTASISPASGYHKTDDATVKSQMTLALTEVGTYGTGKLYKASLPADGSEYIASAGGVAADGVKYQYYIEGVEGMFIQHAADGVGSCTVDYKWVPLNGGSETSPIEISEKKSSITISTDTSSSYCTPRGECSQGYEWSVNPSIKSSVSITLTWDEGVKDGNTTIYTGHGKPTPDSASYNGGTLVKKEAPAPTSYWTLKVSHNKAPRWGTGVQSTRIDFHVMYDDVSEYFTLTCTGSLVSKTFSVPVGTHATVLVENAEAYLVDEGWVTADTWILDGKVEKDEVDVVSFEANKTIAVPSTANMNG